MVRFYAMISPFQGERARWRQVEWTENPQTESKPIYDV